LLFSTRQACLEFSGFGHDFIIAAAP
jgi:hypothetical protein